MPFVALDVRVAQHRYVIHFAGIVASLASSVAAGRCACIGWAASCPLWEWRRVQHIGDFSFTPPSIVLIGVVLCVRWMGGHTRPAPRSHRQSGLHRMRCSRRKVLETRHAAARRRAGQRLVRGRFMIGTTPAGGRRPGRPAGCPHGETAARWRRREAVARARAQVARVRGRVVREEP